VNVGEGEGEGWYVKESLDDCVDEARVVEIEKPGAVGAGMLEEFWELGRGEESAVEADRDALGG